MIMMKGSGNCYWLDGDILMVNFKEIAEIAMIVYDFGETLFINGAIVNEETFGPIITNTYDS